MRSILAKTAIAALLLAGAYSSANAGSLQVEPVLIDVTAAGAAASTLTLHNAGSAPINAQVRVFRWSQQNGEEKLEPTDAVAASPPVLTLGPNAKNIVRIIRLSKQPIVGEESYRLLIDQLPDLSQQKNGGINLMVRYSIPVFFGARNKKSPTLAWSVAVKGSKVTLSARNTGERRLRISALTVRDARGHTISLGAGLAGYTLGQSTKSWTIPGHGFAASGSASISAQSDGGPVQAVASIEH
ncbi:MAG TPA: fimbria/pilus periplasmic chaperone [Xanthobacteraceae bacterium]|nr:fimbria/pilus periplasmic chaperone [Xanthobacteraceae bacterium]